MAQQTINVGASANDRTGDSWRDAMIKSNENFDELYTVLNGKRVFVTSLSDLPAPSGGVYTLADLTYYEIANDLDFGTDRIQMGDRTVVSGLDTIMITLTYSGIGSFFTMTNTTNSIRRMNILHPSGAIYDYSDNNTNVFRMVDVTSSGATHGTMTGTNSFARFTNVSPVLTVGGITWSGNWRVVLFEPSFGSITVGSVFDLGSATFDEIIITQPVFDLSAGASFISGLAGSGNINSGGRGIVTLGSFEGAGSVTSGVDIQDVRWSFNENAPIADSRNAADAYITATETVTINTSGVFEEVDGGNWLSTTQDRFTTDATGVITYNGERDINVQIVGAATVEKTGGGSDELEVRIAKNWTPGGSGILQSSVLTDNNSPTSVPLQALVALSNGDDIRMIVANNDSTSNVIVDRANLTIVGA